MPEFVLDLGNAESARTFTALDDFTQGYIEAMFFTEANPDNKELYGACFDELAPGALTSIVEDCADFQTSFRADLDEAIDNGRINGYDETAAGRDFWFTRQGHGVGFWDRGLGNVGGTLTKMSKPYGVVDVYRGDDGKVYLQ